MENMGQMILTIIVTALTAGGGVTSFFLVRGKQKELEIENLSKVIAQWQQIAEDRARRADELKADLDRRDEKIDALYKRITEYRDSREVERVRRVTASSLICNDCTCTKRTPPFGWVALHPEQLDEILQKNE